MPATDRLLNTLLALYQDVHDAQQTERIFGTTLTLLTELSNPLNLSLLTSQFLTAPAIWHRPEPLHACFRVISVFNTAAIHVRRNELDNANRVGPPVGGGLRSEGWARAVVKGADERSSRWQHVLVLAGILMGMEGNDRRSLSGSMRNTVEHAVVTAANLALRTHAREGPVAAAATVMALNYAFPLLSEVARGEIDCDALLPVAVQTLVGDEGFQNGQFLGVIGFDVKQMGQKLDWPETSASFVHMRQFTSRTLVETAGPLSKVASYAVEHARDFRVVLQAQDDLLAFTGKLLEQWQRIKFSELEVSDEAAVLTPQTLQFTWPMLWQFLQKILFAAVAVLQAVTARSLLDSHIRNDTTAPVVAAKSLHVLRNLAFISSRGNDSFQVYTFTYLTSIDVLARYSEACISFLRNTLPANKDSISSHPLQRTLDLFYLNTAEHLPLNLPPEACESLIIQPATVYLSHSVPRSPRLVELFEAAHSAVLSVLSCPQNGLIAVRVAPFYAETLLSSFPAYISPRQFRLAFKTLMQILSPPFPISASHPELAETLLEMIRFRIPTAGQTPLPPPADDMANQALSSSPMVSEQSALVLTLIDALPFLPLMVMEDWMTMAAMSLVEIPDPAMREVAKQRFWDVLASGEMDVERSAIGVAWWGTKGGRDLVLFGQGAQGSNQAMMSGAIISERDASRL